MKTATHRMRATLTQCASRSSCQRTGGVVQGREGVDSRAMSGRGARSLSRSLTELMAHPPRARLFHSSQKIIAVKSEHARKFCVVPLTQPLPRTGEGSEKRRGRSDVSIETT